jgi:hypothetical protein
MATRSSQPDLFSDADPAAGAGPGLVRIAGPTAKLSKAQQEFNRLSERLARLREHLLQWRAAEDRCAQRAAAELAPLQTQLTNLQAETVLWVNSFLALPPQGNRLPKKLRDKLVAMLRLLARHVLDAGPHPAVEAAHDRHSRQSHRETQREQTDLAAAMFGQAMGDPSLFEGEAESVEALMQRAAERARARDDAAPDGDDRPQHPSSRADSRAGKARARDAQALQEASQSVRDVYRRLASSLHPDREPDAAERQRKTSLMAQVNEAYARRDLLALLAVQLDIEQIDAAHLAGLPDARLKHYIRVLKDQKLALEEELALVQMPVCEQMQAQPGLLRWSPTLLHQIFDGDLHNLRRAITHLQQDSQALRDPATRLHLLRALEIDDPDDAPDPFEELLLMQALGELADAAPQGGAGPRRRRRHRR